jgi:hypothetical protein
MRLGNAAFAHVRFIFWCASTGREPDPAEMAERYGVRRWRSPRFFCRGLAPPRLGDPTGSRRSRLSFASDVTIARHALRTRSGPGLNSETSRCPTNDTHRPGLARGARLRPVRQPTADYDFRKRR